MAYVKNRINRGSGVYTCECCGKRTRETGEGESDCGLCLYCYTEGGLINMLSDGHITQEQYDQELAALKKAHGRS